MPDCFFAARNDGSDESFSPPPRKSFTPCCVVETTNCPPMVARYSFKPENMLEAGTSARISSSAFDAAAVSAGCVTSVTSGIGSDGRT